MKKITPTQILLKPQDIREKQNWQQIFHQIFNSSLCRKFYDLETHLLPNGTMKAQNSTFMIVHRKPDETIRCSNCGKVFRQKPYLRRHIKLCTRKRKTIYKCKCNQSKAFSSIMSLNQHITTTEERCDCRIRPCNHHYKVISKTYKT